jgi:hypothetical protein
MTSTRDGKIVVLPKAWPPLDRIACGRCGKVGITVIGLPANEPELLYCTTECAAYAGTEAWCAVMTATKKERPMSNTKIHTSGNFLAGVSVTTTQFVGVTSLDELKQYGLLRPTLVEDARQRDMKGDADLFDAYQLRGAVNRRFDKPRRKRAVDYAGYIAGVAAGRLTGSTPHLTLFCPQFGAVCEGGLRLPYNVPIVLIDGETQGEARFLLRDQDRESGKLSIPFVLHHGISAAEASSIMHDYNHYAHPVAEHTIAAMNAQGSITIAVNMAIQGAGISLDQIERHSPFKPGKDKITGFGRLMAGSAGFAVGRDVIKGGGIGRAIDRYNNGGKGIDVQAVQPFLVEMLHRAKADRAIGSAVDGLWAVAGIVTAERARVITAQEWSAAAQAFGAQGRDKGQRALAAIGL